MIILATNVPLFVPWNLKILRFGLRRGLHRQFSLTVICGHPFQDRVPVDNDSVMIGGYMDPSLEGAVLFFDCPPQHVLIGPNTTTCMGNGEWEPDPREVECKGIMLAKYSRV